MRRILSVSVMLASVGLLSAAAALAVGPARAQTIIEEWGTAKLPPPPQLKPAKITAPRETALLVMDFTNQTCTKERRPRCTASVPKVAKLVNDARAKGALIIYSITPGATNADILKELTPAAGETILGPIGPDKFIGSDLEKTLKDKGIKTVVAMGTQAQTSVLHTGSAAALRGFKVIVPVDGMSSDDAFPELYTAWHLATAARISNETTLTKFDLIGF